MMPHARRSLRAIGLVLLTAGAMCIGGGTAFAQDGSGAGGGPGPIGTLDLEGAVIDEVVFAIEGSTGNRESDRAIAEQAEAGFGFRSGDRWNGLAVERGLASIEQLAGVAKVETAVERAINPSANRLNVRIQLAEASAQQKPLVAKLPTLHRGEKSYLKLLINGGFGIFSDGNPWFGDPETFTRNNPLVQDPPNGAGTGDRATWTEAYVEYGLGGVAPIGDGGLYIYGAATGVTVASVGRDIFRDDSRSTTDVEKLYAGLLYAPEGRSLRINASVGRQNFTLNDGFLIGQYGAGSQSNAGPRPGIYLAPRTTHDMSAFLTVKADKLVWSNFYIDPNEYEPIESNTSIAGTNLRYNFSKSVYADVSYLYLPTSDSKLRLADGTTRAREGTSTVTGHVRVGLPDQGVWFESECARQWHSDYSMRAEAGYATLGVIARNWPWSPSISYRYASFSGDDPATTQLERFDPLFSGGLGEWLQGISINKALNQANRETHRIRTNVSPKPGLNFTLDYFSHRANDRNNIGAIPAISQLTSRDLGDEWQFVTRWPIAPRLYFVGVVSHANPGRAIRNASTEPLEPWTTFQTQFYFNF